ncbi:MAG: hypothetical protein ACOYYU_21460 [Chloroflexota bacterium]
MKRIIAFLTTPPLALAIAAILAYGLLLPQLGFYWDDLPMSWIRYQLGIEAMARYFSTNRPVWGLLYRVTTRILPQVPIYWQIFALFWRFVSGLLAWGILRELFPKQSRLALATALLFLLYPGFNQQWGAYLYSHFFIVLDFFLLSLYLMLLAQKSRYWLWTLLAMLFSAFNLWMHEYFFTLEAGRIAFLWTISRDQNLDLKPRLRRTLGLWTPYLAVFLAAVLSRLLIFNNQIYEIGSEQAGTTLFDLFTAILSSLWTVTAAAWGQAFRFPLPGADGLRTTALYAAVTLVTAGVGFVSLRPQQTQVGERSGRRDALWAVGLGVFLLLAAGWPFWLTGVPVSLAYPANRATLSFMLGASLLAAGLLALLPQRLNWVLATILVTLAAGRQFLWSNEFRRDWNAQKNLFWQMTWRAPGLAPGTIVLMNEELSYYADNSLGAVLNWAYAPDNHTDRVDYALFYPTNRLDGALVDLEPGLPVSYDYLAGQFSGNTSQVVAFYYAPPGCLRLLDPEIDPYNRLLPAESLMREAASLSTTEPVLGEPLARMPGIYGLEPAHGWCYYFEQADLARQALDWEQVAALGDQAFALNDYPNDPLERFVFIEGYAHTGDWEKALKLSQDSYNVSKNVVGPLLCRLWERIEGTTTASPQKDEFVRQVVTMFVCNQ